MTEYYLLLERLHWSQKWRTLLGPEEVWKELDNQGHPYDKIMKDWSKRYALSN